MEGCGGERHKDWDASRSLHLATSLKFVRGFSQDLTITILLVNIMTVMSLIWAFEASFERDKKLAVPRDGQMRSTCVVIGRDRLFILELLIIIAYWPLIGVYRRLRSLPSTTGPPSTSHVRIRSIFTFFKHAVFI
ncbi:hypothetical protein BJV78DRAFT_1231643 [Lactifluus subvellereus]|nr:hypothetical protein BJV78DRAFT_1231643 [Lactifluus subvellereus]